MGTELQNLITKSEVGSGLKDNRMVLCGILKNVVKGKVSKIVVLYKERLTRFGFNYLKLLCESYNTEIVVIKDDIEKLVKRN